jgi:hypothetical protein
VFKDHCEAKLNFLELQLDKYKDITEQRKIKKEKREAYMFSKQQTSTFTDAKYKSKKKTGINKLLKGNGIRVSKGFSYEKFNLKEEVRAELMKFASNSKHTKKYTHKSAVSLKGRKGKK